MNYDQQELRRRLQAPLPGRSAQYRMASVQRLRVIAPDFVPPSDAKQAAVLIVLHRVDPLDTWQTLLIQRTANPHDRHSGQVSFPGGRHEPDDGSMQATALREAEEEVGLSATAMQVVGALTPLYIPVSDFMVHPYVAVTDAPLDIRTQPSEVESVFMPALSHFMEDQHIEMRDITIGPNVHLPEVPCFIYQERVIWGATAMILSELVEVMG
jgi:8-oxo-dGTP pyrophosphatase MutT (NUDIX family)